MKVLVTGATGLIGAEVVQVLAQRGYEVVATGRRAEPRFGEGLCVALHRLDLFDRQGTRQIMQGVDAVVHMANLVGWTEKDLTVGLLGNMQVHLNVIQGAIEAGVKKFVFAGSVHAFNGVYCDGTRRPGYTVPYLPLDGQVPLHAMSPYGMSKQFCEHVLGEMSPRCGMASVLLRLPLVVSHHRAEDFRAGKGQTHAGSISDGFAYMSVKDCATLVEAILRSQWSGLRVYFPASLNNALGLTARDAIEQHYPGVPLRKPIDQIESLVDLSQITADTGWRPLY
jgi:nucleoside-diphosphate-sugar epimerase